MASPIALPYRLAIDGLPTVAIGALGIVYGDIGTSPLYALKEAVKAASGGGNFVVFFISPASVESQLASLELQVALHRQVHGEGGAVILPVLLEDADAPPLLRQFQWMDLRDGDIEKGVGRLIRRIRGKARRQPQPPFRTRQGRVEPQGHLLMRPADIVESTALR